MRYLGVDFGLKKTGLALGDDEIRIASPLEVIPGGDDSFAHIKRIVLEEDIEGIVVGMPGTEGSEQFEKTTLFVERLEERLDQKIYTIDENFTSVESRRLQEESGSKVPEDALAAMLILQAFFSEQS